MKTQRRHELQTNQLADYLGMRLQQIQPYYTHITVGVVAIAALCVGGVYYMNTQKARGGVSWSDYFDAFGARDAKALERVGEVHDGTTAALWAQQSAGDIKLATGAGTLYTDRDEAETSLKDAEKLFLAVEAGTTEDTMLRQRACFGLGQVYESLFKIEKAQEYYGKAAASDPDSAFGKAATRRCEQLSDPAVQGWYNWFGRQKPVVPGGASGSVSDGPRVSDDLDTLPDRPNPSFPGSGILDELKDMKPDANEADEAPMEEAGEEGIDAEEPSAESKEETPADAAVEVEAKPAPEEPKPAPKDSEPATEESKPVPNAGAAEAKEESKSSTDEPASQTKPDSTEPDKKP